MNAVRFSIAAAVALVLCLAGAGTTLAMNTGDAGVTHAVLAPGDSAGGVYILAPDQTTGADTIDDGDGYTVDFHYAD